MFRKSQFMHRNVAPYELAYMHDWLVADTKYWLVATHERLVADAQ